MKTFQGICDSDINNCILIFFFLVFIHLFIDMHIVVNLKWTNIALNKFSTLCISNLNSKKGMSNLYLFFENLEWSFYWIHIFCFSSKMANSNLTKGLYTWATSPWKITVCKQIVVCFYRLNNNNINAVRKCILLSSNKYQII
jgi:hypothetical protein